MSELDTENFKQLPIELQRIILTHSPDALKAFSQASREYQKILDVDYEALFCQPMYSSSESRNYLQSGLPQIFSSFSVIQGIVGTTGLTGTIGFRQQGSQYTIETIKVNLAKHVIINGLVIDYDVADINVADYPLASDFLAIYRIYMNRSRCTRINQKYAKQKTLDTLNIYYDIYKEALNEETDNNLGKIASVYIVLYLNSYNFNIYPSPRIELLNNFVTNIATVKREIGRLYTSIGKSILALD